MKNGENIDNCVVVAGTFDLFHYGHMMLLKRASTLGNVLVLVNTDEFVKKFKGITPAQNTEERMKMVDALGIAKLVRANDSDDLTKTIEKEFSYFFKQYEYGHDKKIVGIVFGDDYDIEKYRAQTKITPEWQTQHDIALIQFPRTPGVSSSMLREKLDKK